MHVLQFLPTRYPLCAVMLLAILAVVSSPNTTTFADAPVLITKASKFSASETLDRLTDALESKSITIFVRVDHTIGAKKAGMDLPPTELLIFGNPKLGTPLMTANRSIAIDLPMKALAWTDADGKTWLSYTDPAVLKARWSIADRDEIFAKMAGALDKLTNGATGN
ncbi:MAG: DUF302 domain-containing protein [Hyphomicrobiaceae bacterium]